MACCCTQDKTGREVDPEREGDERLIEAGLTTNGAKSDTTFSNAKSKVYATQDLCLETHVAFRSLCMSQPGDQRFQCCMREWKGHSEKQCAHMYQIQQREMPLVHTDPC